MSATQHSNVCHRRAMADTTYRALRRERVGRREPPVVEGASRVRVVSIHRRCRALSPGITCCGGWVILKNCTAYKSDSAFSFCFDFFFVFLFSLDLNLLLLRKCKRLFICFVFFVVVRTGPNYRLRKLKKKRNFVFSRNKTFRRARRF